MLLFIVFSFLALAQVFIPFGRWKPTGAVLTISDGATYSYGSININTPTDKTFTLTNTSTQFAVSNISSQNFTFSNYTFKGGTFPGTGGTCTTTLVASGSCSFVVTSNSNAIGTVADTIRINYFNQLNLATSTRAVTTTYTNTAAVIVWLNPPSFIKVNTCQALTLQTQDGAGNAVTLGTATAINLFQYNGLTGTYFSNSGCGTTITSTTILASTNSITIYYRNTTANQTGILTGTATAVGSASVNIIINNNPTKLFINPSPTIKTATCTIVPIYSVDASNFQSAVNSNTTINLSTTGSNIFYSDSGCTSSITSILLLSGTSLVNIYTSNLTVQTSTLTATDAGAVLTLSSKSVNFNTSLTWWNSSWTKRVRIDINNSDQAAAFTNQPVLVNLSSSNVNYSEILANGADIRFVASDDVTALNYEFDNWNYNGVSQVWVRVPSIAASSSAGYIYVYYNNPAATDAQNKTGVWSNFWAVWHLNEDPTTAAPQYLDSTSNARNGTAVNSPTRTTGQIGLSAQLSANTDGVRINTDLSTVLGVSSTFSAWMRTSQAGGASAWTSPGIAGVEQGGGGNDIFYGWIVSSGRIRVTAGNGASAESGFVVNNNAWRHVTISRNSASGAVAFYINGVLNGSATSETGAKTLAFDMLGEIRNGPAVNYNGLLDEVRIYNSVQSADQVRADFKFMMNTHLLYGSIETGP